MAGTTLDGELRTARPSRVPFALAGPADDGEIRRLLRENPMPGRIALTLEREPDYFADAHLPGTEKQTVIARDGESVICAGSCTIRDRFVNGQPRRVGYLGGLRLDSRAAGRFAILRGGYEVFRKLQTDQPADFYFTSIASDNISARRFLERGLPGMPKYEFVGEFVTALIAVKRRSATLVPAKTEPPDSTELVDFLNRHGRGRQFASRWSTDELTALATLGLQSQNFHFACENGRIAAVAAIWDQRVFKQTVIRGYESWLAMTRPAVNFVARMRGTPCLPAVGSTLSQAYISPFVITPEGMPTCFELVEHLRALAAEKGIEYLTLGFAANDPGLAILRGKVRFREYRSRIYVVRWPDLGGSARVLDARCLGPEVALL